MKKLTLLLFLALGVVPAFAQTPSRVDGTFQDALGRALSGATVYVCTQPCVSTSIPPSPLATLFSDGVSTPVTTAGQVLTDGNGNFFFYTLAPIFTEVFVYRGRIVKILPDQVPKGGGAGFNCGSPLAPGILYFNGTACVVDTNATDDTNLAGNIVVASLTTPGTVTATNFVTTGSGGVFGGTQQSAPANPLTNQYALYVDSTSGKLTCLLGPSLTNCMPAGGGGAITISTNSVNNTSQTVLNFVNPATFNGLTATFSNPTSGNETFAFGGSLDLATQTHPSITVAGVTCTLGGSCSPPVQPVCSTPGSSDTLTQAGGTFPGTFATTCSVPSTAIVGVGQYLHVIAHGVQTTTATASPIVNIQVNAGGTTGICASSTNTSISASQTNESWDIDCNIQIVTTGAPGTAIAWGKQNYANNAQGGPAAINPRFSTNAGAVNYTTTSAQTVSVQETATPVAGQSITLQSLVVTNY